MENQTCKDCRFWMPENRNEVKSVDHEGWCRRYPSTPVFQPNAVIYHLPVTAAGDWCGEFQSEVAGRPSNQEFAREIWKIAAASNKARAIEQLTKFLDVRLG